MGTKTLNVIMVATNIKAKIGEHILVFNFDDNLLRCGIKIRESFNTNDMNHHLYFISDDEIKDGDWYIRLFDNVLFKANSQSDHKHYDCKKIEAATRKSIILPGDFPDSNTLAEIPRRFVESYIKPYNENNPITTVIVESYSRDENEFSRISTDSFNKVIFFKPKVYTKQEVNSLIQLAWASCDSTLTNEEIKLDCLSWIEKNI